MTDYDRFHSAAPRADRVRRSILVLALMTLGASCLMALALRPAASSADSRSTIGTAASRGASGPDPSDPAVVYRSLSLTLRPGNFAEYRFANCSGTWGEGTGHCGGDNGYSSSRPSLGGTWKMLWWPCQAAPFPVSGGCAGRALAIEISSGQNDFKAVMASRGSADLYLFEANAPAWKPVGPIVLPNAPFAPRNNPGGPLYINVRHDSGNRYNIDINGFVAYKRIARTFDLSGYLRYADGGGPPASHRFTAKLDVFDTPDDPPCNATYLVGAGGCRGTFTSESTPPFSGAGGSIHWRAESGRYLEEVIAPDGGRFNGTVEPGLNALFVTSGTVPSWGTGISTGSDITSVGQDGGPLQVTQTAASVTAVSPSKTEITGLTVNHRLRRVAIRFRNSGPRPAKGFQCLLDNRRLTPCQSPMTYSNLSKGRHRFAVRSLYSSGMPDRSPPTRWFTI